jgi:predicted transcriptional regulator
MKRNFYGLKKETLSLFEKDLVDMTEDAWHLTFEITELGNKFFEAE